MLKHRNWFICIVSFMLVQTEKSHISMSFLLSVHSVIRFATLLHQCLNSIKKGSAKEIALASHTIGDHLIQWLVIEMLSSDLSGIPRVTVRRYMQNEQHTIKRRFNILITQNWLPAYKIILQAYCTFKWSSFLPR